VAAIVVAGGVGTRLGLSGPKGALPIGPVSGRSLFAHHAAQIRGAARRDGGRIPWLVMTSHHTDTATRALFERDDSFGLPPEDVFFLCQRDLPALDFEGNLMVSDSGGLVLGPDGHGGLLGALRESALLPTLADRGVETLSYFQIDNPLLPVLDATAIGRHLAARAQWTAKVVAKQAPEEKLGAWVRRGETGARIVEYTELGPAEREARSADGSLRLGTGSIGAHLFDRAWLADTVAGRPELPIHLSPKQIPAVAALPGTGFPLGPGAAPANAPNGFRLERFVFDALPYAERAHALGVDRADEYAPVKNATGSHTPDDARRALSDRNRRWLARAGVAVDPRGTVDIDPAHWPDVESLCAARGAANDGIAHQTILIAGGEEA